MTNPTSGVKPPIPMPIREWDRLKKTALDAMVENRPDLWRQCYPRIYDETANGQFDSVKLVSADMFGAAFKVEQGALGTNEKAECVWASRMARYRVPVYWITPDMAEAIKKTTPPQSVDVRTLHLPFEACAFMIPRGTLIHEDSTEGDACYVSYFRTHVGDVTKSLATAGPQEWVSMGNGVLTILAHTRGDHLLHWTIPDTETFDLAHLDKLVHLFESEVPNHESQWPQVWNTGDLSHADNAFMGRVTHFVLGTVILMNSRPDLVTSGALRKKVSKANQAPKEFWTPNVIGQNYKIRRLYEDKGGTHASPRGHWVRGFYREQPYGPERSLRRETWIEPFWRGGDAE